MTALYDDEHNTLLVVPSRDIDAYYEASADLHMNLRYLIEDDDIEFIQAVSKILI